MLGQGAPMGRQVSQTKEAAELGPNAYEVSDESKGGRRISKLLHKEFLDLWVIDCSTVGSLVNYNDLELCIYIYIYCIHIEYWSVYWIVDYVNYCAVLLCYCWTVHVFCVHMALFNPLPMRFFPAQDLSAIQNGWGHYDPRFARCH